MQVAHRKWARKLMDLFGEGEKLLWSDRPRTGITLRKADVVLIPVSIAMVAGALWGANEAITRYGSREMPETFRWLTLWIPIGLGGLLCAYYLLGRFVVDAFRRRTTYYGLSNQRIIILNGLTGAETSIGLLTIEDADLRVLGSGQRRTVRLRRPGIMGWLFHEWRAGTGFWFPPLAGSLAPRLDLVEDADAVVEAIRKARRKAEEHQEKRRERKKNRKQRVAD